MLSVFFVLLTEISKWKVAITSPKSNILKKDFFTELSILRSRFITDEKKELCKCMWSKIINLKRLGEVVSSLLPQSVPYRLVPPSYPDLSRDLPPSPHRRAPELRYYYCTVAMWYSQITVTVSELRNVLMRSLHALLTIPFPNYDMSRDWDHIVSQAMPESSFF